MTPEEIAALVEAAVSKAVGTVLIGLQSTGAAFGSTNRIDKRVLEPKGVSRVDAYVGKEGTWREWSFQFRVAIKSMQTKVAEVLTKVESDDKAH